MNTLETLCSRRSIRNFTGDSISDEELETLLKVANASPVGMGQYETLHITVITDKDLLNRIEDECASYFNKPNMHPLYGAPMFIVISSSNTTNMNNVAYSNAAMMVHNIAIEAVELGLGTCYIWGAISALNNNQELVNELDLPDNFVPCCGIVIGKTDEKYELREIPSRVAINKI